MTEMWPYAASAAALSESHAATAVLKLLSVMTPFMVGRGVGSGVGAQAPSPCLTPHDVDAHWVPENVVVHAPAEDLFKGRGVLKHLVHIRDAVDRPTTDVLVI